MFNSRASSLLLETYNHTFSSSLRWQDILEQPIITPSDILPESWHFVHLPYDDKVYRFGLPTSNFEDINIWVHEFTEQSLNKILGKKNDPTLLFISGENGFFIDFSHILTSLCCTSSVKIDDKIIIMNSNEFYEFLKTKKLYKAWLLVKSEKLAPMWRRLISISSSTSQLIARAIMLFR